MLNDQVVLITGGTGSFGRAFAEVLFQQFRPKKIIIFSRDEFKQFEMAKTFPQGKYPIRYFLGDIRDKSRLFRAFHGVDCVIHAAALKQVPALEYNPSEAVKTNIIGAENIVDAAIDCGVKQVVALSTDKAVNPNNLYGATKLTMEKIFVAARNYSAGGVKFSVVRYGNVIGSRGSVLPIFLNLRNRRIREFPITDERMTRFWITLKESIDIVFKALETAVGGEIFIPKIPSMKIIDFARAVDPDCRLKLIGIRAGEKIHETLISEHESRSAKDCSDFYTILPQFYETIEAYLKYGDFPSLPDRFEYRSDNNEAWLSTETLRALIPNVPVEMAV